MKPVVNLGFVMGYEDCFEKGGQMVQLEFIRGHRLEEAQFPGSQKESFSQASWRRPLIPALRRQRQVKICEIKAILNYILSSRAAWTTEP